MRRIIRGLKGVCRNLLDSSTGLSRHKDTPFEPFEMGGLVAACHGSFPTDPTLLNQWEALSRIDSGTMFHSPVWQRAAWDRFSQNERLRLVTVHRGPALLAVLPLALSMAGDLQSLAPGVSDYLDPLVDSDAQEDCWRTILSMLRSLWDDRVVEFILHNVRQASSARKTLAAVAAGEGFIFEERIGENCPAIHLPQTWEKYLESLEAHERRETRRRFNKAYEKGGARLVHSAAELDPVAALDKAIDILGAGAGEKAAAFHNTLKPILKAAGPPLIKVGRLDVATLYVEDIASGVLLIAPGHEGPMLYNTGFDIARKEWSPGTVAVASGIREAIAQNAPVFDMLRGTEPYKYRLGAVDRPLYRLTLKRA